MSRTETTAAVIGIVLSIFLLTWHPVSAPSNGVARSEPTTAVRTGYLATNTPGTPTGQFFLVHEEPGKPALTTRLIFDEISVCAAGNGALPCMAMSTTWDIAFGGKLLSIEGTEKNGSLVVRKLQVIKNGNIPRTPAVGSVFISWPNAVSLLERCVVRGVVQTHALDVYLALSDGTSVRAVEPTIDEVFRVLARTSCPAIPQATE